MTPALVVIGAQKSGTTAVFAMLSKHPKAVPPTTKELHFFNREENYSKGMSYYRSLFPVIPAKSFGHFTFEASPGYLSDASISAPRIALHLPKATCLAILRDPVKRAFSAWNMYRTFQNNRKHGHLYEPRTFAKAVEDELAGKTRLAAHKYLARGCYADQLDHFYKAIGPGHLLVKSYIDLKHDPDGFINDLCKHMGWAQLPNGLSLMETKAGVLPYGDKLDPILAAELYKYFVPEMEKLEKVLGKPISILEGNG